MNSNDTVLNLDKFLDYASGQLKGGRDQKEVRQLLQDFLLIHGRIERDQNSVEVIYNPAPLIERFRQEVLKTA